MRVLIGASFRHRAAGGDPVVPIRGDCERCASAGAGVAAARSRFSAGRACAFCPRHEDRHLEHQLDPRPPRAAHRLARAGPRPTCSACRSSSAPTRSSPPRRSRAAGYQSVCFGQKTYNGVAILARSELARVHARPRRRGRGPAVAAGRRGGRRGDRLQRLRAQRAGGRLAGVRVQARVVRAAAAASSTRRHRPTEPLVVCGDFNVAPEARRRARPRALGGADAVQPPRAGRAREAAAASGCDDTFREQHPGEPKFYAGGTTGCSRSRRTAGLRIDHLLATPPLLARCTAAGIDREARKGKQPSDHAPVWAEFA